MNVYRARPLNYPWTTIFFVSALSFSGLLHHVAPLHLFDGAPQMRSAVAASLLMLGAVVSLWAFITLHRHQTALASMKATTRLVTCGPFRLTRNPVYLGYVLMAFGYALAANDVWAAALSLSAAIATHLWVIRREEQYLQSRFGYEFERYRQQTRVWL
jgi:protein-S-isoprenylcysteine O-methyltransferase Ste14